MMLLTEYCKIRQTLFTIYMSSRDGPNLRFGPSQPTQSRRFGQAHRRSAELRPNVVCYDETCFTGERTERLENVVINKQVNMHASSEMANYVEKLQRIVY